MGHYLGNKGIFGMKGFLKDDKGNWSMMRLNMGVALLVAIAKTFIAPDIAMVSLWLGVATLGKLGQKFSENK